MAGNIPKRLLKRAEVDKCLLGGTRLFKFEEGDAPQKLTFYADKDGFFLRAVGDSQTKHYDQYIWDFHSISDVRSSKPKDIKLFTGPEDSGGGEKADIFLTLVIIKDGIASTENINLFAEKPANAQAFKKAVNALTYNKLVAHGSPELFLRKQYVRIKLHANGNGEIPLRSINKVMMIRYAPENYLNQWLGSFNIVKETVDGKSKYIHVDNFTEDLFFKMVDQLLNNRDKDIDAIFTTLSTGRSRGKMSLPLDNFLRFLNDNQRDPRLNEILFPKRKKAEAAELISQHEKGRTKDRLTAKGLMEYLMSDDNNILDLDHLNQNHDMSQPISHYYINSSHNTYLVGHQLRSASTAEMYAQCLLLGCRCLELDCWPENNNNDIIITHGGTFCGKVAFEDVVVTINEFAFIASDYPLILSIENHCRKWPHLLQRMANVFKMVFGDKLMATPLDSHELLEGVPLPSPEQLKHKILIKDKKVRAGMSNGVSTASFIGESGTLTRGTHLPTVPEEGQRENESNTEKTPNDSALQEVTVTSSEPVKQSQNSEPVLPEANHTTEGDSQMTNESTATDDKELNDVVENAADGDSKPDVNEVISPDREATPTSSTTPPTSSSPTGDGKEAEGSKSNGQADENNTSVTSESGGGSGGGGNNSVKVNKKLIELLGIQEGDSKGNTPEGGKIVSLKRGSLSGSAIEGDITQINVAMLHRGSDAEITVSGPYADIINYCTSITFEGFALSEKTNCSFYMSSFVEEKGLGLIKTQGKEFVKYNARQLSRIYPQGSRISSSNYGPMIYWSVGCQLVALNYQTSDIPMQLNLAKFEFNGGTGYLLKPWVMTKRSGTGVGEFNPFVQSKLEDIVPARVSIKVISGIFLTEKRTNCYVECEMYGLPADNLRHRYFTKRCPAPHPHWNDEEFKFKRILLPELAMMRVCVYDDDKEVVGQRVLPVNAIRPGFRHISLRDKHGTPLPLATLFVLVKVEDWVPDEFEDIVAMLMDPISYATQVLKEMDEDLGEDEKAFMAKQQDSEAIETTDAPSPNPKSSLNPSGSNDGTPRGVSPRGVSPRPDTFTPSATSGTSYASASLRRGEGAGASMGNLIPSSFDESLPCLEVAKSRAIPEAISHTSKHVVQNSAYVKLVQKLDKQRADMIKKHDKTIKSQQDKLAKGKSGVTEESIRELEKKKEGDLMRHDKKASEQKYEIMRSIMETAHKVQLKTLAEKVHKNDIKTVNVELGDTLKKHRKGSDVGELDRKQSLLEIEEKTVTLGRKARTEFQKIHDAEMNKLMEAQKQCIKDLVSWQASQLDEINSRAEGVADRDEAAAVL